MSIKNNAFNKGMAQERHRRRSEIQIKGFPQTHPSMLSENPGQTAPKEVSNTIDVDASSANRLRISPQILDKSSI